MVKITYIDQLGDQNTVQLEPGATVMEGARNNDIEGILADCGGACACATCHVYVDPAWVEFVGDKSDAEAGLLEMVTDLDAQTSRLACQITVSEDLDGLVVRTPESQG